MWLTGRRLYSKYADLKELVEMDLIRTKPKPKPITRTTIPIKETKTKLKNDTKHLSSTLQKLNKRYYPGIASLNVQNSQLGQFHAHGASKFVGSAYNTKQLEELEILKKLPSVMVLGRCNVGKSSLVNALVGAEVARVKSYAGLTPCLNIYNVGGAFCVVDTPGYGIKGKEWQGALVGEALDLLSKLQSVFVVADASRGAAVSPFDLAVYDMLAEKNYIGNKLCTVLNKCDVAEESLGAVASAYAVESGSPVVGVSAARSVVGAFFWAIAQSVQKIGTVARVQKSVGRVRTVEERERRRKAVAERREEKRKKKMGFSSSTIENQ